MTDTIDSLRAEKDRLATCLEKANINALSREELIAMAREADPFGDDGRLVSLAMLTPGTLERFAALVAAREREACAHVCLELAAHWLGDPVLAGMSDGAEDCAAAIRERGNP